MLALLVVRLAPSSPAAALWSSHRVMRLVHLSNLVQDLACPGPKAPTAHRGGGEAAVDGPAAWRFMVGRPGLDPGTLGSKVGARSSTALPRFIGAGLVGYVVHRVD